MDIIKGLDDKDMTSLPDDGINYVDNLNNKVKRKKLFYINEAIEIDNGSKVLRLLLDNFRQPVNKCKEIGIEVYEVSFRND
jgi:hypothetical protein